MTTAHRPPPDPSSEQPIPSDFRDAVIASTRAVFEAQHPITALFHVTTVIAREFGATRCSVIGPFGPAVVRILASSDAEPAEDLVISLDRYPELRLALESVEPVLIRDVSVSKLMQPVRDLVRHSPTISVATVPLRFPEFMGILRITSNSKHLTPADLARLRGTAHVIEREIARASIPDADEECCWAALARQFATVILEVAGDTRIVSVSGDPEGPLERQFAALVGRPLSEALADPDHGVIGPSVVELMQGRNPTSPQPLITRFAAGPQSLLHAVATPCRQPPFRVLVGLQVVDAGGRVEGMLLNRIAVPLVVIDPRDSVLTTANSAAVALLGRSEENLAGRPLSDFLTRDGQRFRLHENPHVTGVLRTSRADGGGAPLDPTIVALQPDASGPGIDTRLQATLEQQSEELERLRRKVDELMDHRTLFLAASAHELKTPLTILQIYLETLLGDLSDGMTEEQLEFLRITHESLLRLRRLVLNLVDLGALESGGLALEFERIDLESLLTEVVDEMRPLARHAGVDLDLQIPKGLPSARADAARLKQVVRNLVDNAIKYTPADGRVLLQAIPDGHSVVVTVEDTGIGIPEDQHENIFHEYVRLEGNEPEGDAGSGLGLAVCRRMATALGGRITVTSKVGEGTTFAVRLPRWPEDQTS
jgi:signal transduction histidine kinase